MNSRCHLCGAAEATPDSPIGSPTCEGCRPIRDHVVSMQRAANGDSLAVCPCGWRSQVPWTNGYLIQEVKVRLHWRDVIRRAVARFDAEFGEGAAGRELEAAIGGLALFIFLSCDAIGVLLLASALRGAGA